MDFSSRYQEEFVLPLVEGSAQCSHFCTHTPKYKSEVLLLASLNALTSLEVKNSVSPGLRAHFQAQITSSNEQMLPSCYLKASVLFLSTAEFHMVSNRNVIYPSEAMN